MDLMFRSQSTCGGMVHQEEDSCGPAPHRSLPHHQQHSPDHSSMKHHTRSMSPPCRDTDPGMSSPPHQHSAGQGGPGHGPQPPSLHQTPLHGPSNPGGQDQHRCHGLDQGPSFPPSDNHPEPPAQDHRHVNPPHPHSTNHEPDR